MVQNHQDTMTWIRNTPILAITYIITVVAMFIIPLGFLTTYTSTMPIYGGPMPYTAIQSFLYIIGPNTFYLGPNFYLILFWPLIFVAIIFRIWLPFDVIQYVLGGISRARVVIIAILADAQILGIFFLFFGGPYGYYLMTPLPMACIACIPLYFVVSRTRRNQ